MKMLTATVLIIGMLLSVSANAETKCKVKQFSALPHSFGGVTRCENDNEWMNEAMSRCRNKAREVFPSTPSVSFSFRQFFTPDYRGDAVMEENKCKKRVLGQCVDYYRECKATFSRLNCRVEVCRTVDDRF